MEVWAPLFTYPLKGVSFALLILSFIFIWIKRRWGLWFLLFLGSFVSAYYAKIAELRTAVPVLLLIICHFLLTRDFKGFTRLFLVMIPTMISFALLTHFLKGFSNLLLISQWKSAPNALPINFYMTYDKPLIALFVLGFALPLIHTRKALLRTLLFTLPAALLTIALLFFLATYLNLVVFDPKFPPIFLLFLLLQIFFVTIPEEVFFRGFLQREITKDLPNQWGALLAILITSILFTAPHAFCIPNASYLLLTFIASLCYGTLFYLTGHIESSILLHLLVNLTHFLFFTYPLLSPL